MAFSSAAVGSAPHMAAALFGRVATVEFTHVPYPGVAPATMALVGGQVQGAFQGSLLMPHVRSGALRAIATAGVARSRWMPEVPTVGEQGYPGAEVEVWYGILGPAGMSSSLVSRLYDDIRLAMATSVVQKQLEALSIDAEDIGPAEFADRLRDDLRKWTDLARAVGLSTN